MSAREENRVWDLLIIGGGSAGLAAAIYGGRARMSTLLLEAMTTGGEASRTDIIENYPGFIDPIHGPELMERFHKQAERFGANIDYAWVTKLESDGEIRVATLDDGAKVRAHAVVIATGSSHKLLEVPGEKEFTNSGVSYCATCDGPLFKDVPIAVIGGGDSAVEEGTFLTRFGSKVYVVHRRDKLRATKIVQERALANPKMEFVWDSVVDSIEGDKIVRAINLKNVKSGEINKLPVEGVFIFIGMVPNTAFAKGYIKMSDGGNIFTDEYMRTDVPGVYAAGDCRTHSYRQVATAVGDAVTAAIDAEKYVEALKHKLGAH